MNLARLPGRMAPLPRLPTVTVIGAVFAIFLGCDQAPAASMEWTAADHDKQEQASNQQQGLQQAPHPLPSGAQGAQLVEITWMQNCAVCHGARGVGDGPNGPMVKAPDLTSAEW